MKGWWSFSKLQLLLLLLSLLLLLFVPLLLVLLLLLLKRASAKEGTPPHDLQMSLVEQPYGSNEEESEQQPSEVRAVDCDYSGLCAAG